MSRKAWAVAIAGLALAIGAGHRTLIYAAPCADAEPLPEVRDPMKAVVYRCYGPAEVLELVEVEKPTPADNQVLVRVRAAAINPVDWHFMTGTPVLMRVATGVGKPNDPRFGNDFAGVVVAIGKSVGQFEVGEEVFGSATGALAEYVAADADRIVRKPPRITFEQAAAIPVAAVTALQGLRDKGEIGAGQKVLINGASGGVGTFAVQLAKALGAEVTGVCSSRNVDLVRALGADHVIDYTRENFTEMPDRYDLILDNVGNHSLRATRRALARDGILVVVSGPDDNKWLGALVRPIKTTLSAPFVRQRMRVLLANITREDLELLGELVESGKVTPVIDRSYRFEESADAVAYVGEGHARAKVVVALD